MIRKFELKVLVHQILEKWICLSPKWSFQGFFYKEVRFIQIRGNLNCKVAVDHLSWRLIDISFKLSCTQISCNQYESMETRYKTTPPMFFFQRRIFLTVYSWYLRTFSLFCIYRYVVMSKYCFSQWLLFTRFFHDV